MKHIIISLLATLTALAGTAQTANYEAANWKPRLLDNPQQITIAAPPSAVQTKAELQTLKKGMERPDEKKLAEIKYWDAGAPAYRWNQISASIMTWDKVDLVLRTPSAWMNLAIYDATILAWKEKLKHKRARPGIKALINPPLTYSYPCEHTVTASAAAHVLAYFLPAKGDSILGLARKASQSRIDAGVQFPSDAEAGWKLGEEVAKQVIEKAKNDGSAKAFDGKVNKDPKKWTGAYPLGINLPLLTTLGLRSADQFRPAAPPDFESEMKDIKNYKQNFRSRSLAFYWANSGPELYNDIASDKLFEYHMMEDAPAAARVYTIMHT
ncbi:MAG TPA: phosphatase PAP2 family protein, partial [Ferruginibacter sp.]|nr:phosphatase PAP2 family protein [Ferruginibacter sp.]